MRDTISVLNGPPSSISLNEGFICGSSDAGVLGIATVDPPLTCCTLTSSIESDLGLTFEEDPGVSCGIAAFDDDRRLPSSVRAPRSVTEKNFFITWARNVGDAPFMDLPLTIVTFPVFASA